MEYDAGISRSQIKIGPGLYLVRRRPLFRILTLPSERFIVLWCVEWVE